MASHEVYRRIVTALQKGKLREPFSSEDFRRACPGLGEGTYNAFLYSIAREIPAGTANFSFRLKSIVSRSYGHSGTASEYCCGGHAPGKAARSGT